MTQQQTTPDFASMSREELIKLAASAPAGVFSHATDVTVREPDDVHTASLLVVTDMISVTFRVNADQIARIDALAGRDKEGRSGILRQAVEEFLNRHDQAERTAA